MFEYDHPTPAGDSTNRRFDATIDLEEKLNTTGKYISITHNQRQYNQVSATKTI